MITINIDKANKCNGEMALYVSFPYEERVVSVIRSLPSRYWNKDTKEWEIPYGKLPVLISELSDHEFDISGVNVVDKPKTVKLPKNFKFKTKPFQHQIDGFNYGLKSDRWLLGDEQGLGKTKQVIDIAVAKKLINKYQHCLIICGVNGLKWNWQSEIATHSNEESWILGQRMVKHTLKVGGNSAKLDDLKQIDKLPYFIITNVESLRNEPILKELIDTPLAPGIVHNSEGTDSTV